MPKLPRTAWVWGIAGLAVILVFVVFSYSTETTTSLEDLDQDKEKEKSTTLKQVLTAQFADQDSDGDGLRDWEESLWSTDPHNVDTDNDGTTDGEEVDQDRDPTIPGPDDARDILLSSTDAQNDDHTATEAFSQQFFTDYVTLRQSGQLTEQFGQDFLFRQAVNQIPILSITSYTTADVITVSDTEDNVRTYGNNLGLIFLTSGYQGERNELEILEEALVRDNKEDLEALEEIEQAFGNTIDTLSLLTVPQNTLDAHLQLLNGLSKVRVALSELRNIYQDPLTGAASLQLYQEGARQTAEALVSIKAYFTSKNVQFLESETGSFFSNITS